MAKRQNSVRSAAPSQRRYTPDFKRDAVALLASSGRPIAQVAKELGISDVTLAAWARDQERGRRVAESEETADDVTPALRRRVSERVAELEAAIVVRRERLVALARASATEVPTLADVAPMLDRLPILPTSLDAAPQGELRALFDALQLDVVYQPADSAVDVAVTLYDGGGGVDEVAAQVRAEDWSAPPAGAGPVLRRVVRLRRRLELA